VCLQDIWGVLKKIKPQDLGIAFRVKGQAIAIEFFSEGVNFDSEDC
jgi:hypothetical protein